QAHGHGPLCCLLFPWGRGKRSGRTAQLPLDDPLMSSIITVFGSAETVFRAGRWPPGVTLRQAARADLRACVGKGFAVMALGLLGLKVGMTQVYDEKGKLAPVTVLQVGPCPVLQVRNQERDGYDAIQLGFLDKPRRKATRPERGHVAAEFVSNRRKNRQSAGVAIPPKADVEPQRYIREFRLDAASDTQVGAILTAADVFKDVPRVDVIGTSKGRGFTGNMKRHNFGGLRGSHGVKKGN